MIRTWKLKKVVIVPIVVGALGVVTPNIEMVEKVDVKGPSGALTKDSTVRDSKDIEKTFERLEHRELMII